MINKIYKNPGRKIVDIEGEGLHILTVEGESKKKMMDVEEYQNASIVAPLVSEDIAPHNPIGHCEVNWEEKRSESSVLERDRKIHIRILEGGKVKDISWDEAKTVLES